MKTNLIKTLAACAVCTIALWVGGCTDNDDTPHPGMMVTSTFNVNHSLLVFDSNGVWDKADDISANNVVSINNADYSRFVNPARNTLFGFQPCQITDTTVTEAGVNGLERGPYNIGSATPVRSTYMNACWDKTESLTSVPLLPSCKISLSEAREFIPVSVSIANNAVTYAAMKKGLGMPAFTNSGECTLLIYGVYNGKRTEPVRVKLGEGTIHGFEGMNVWKNVNLDDLGYVNYIYFQMESSAGMDVTPPYFCIRSLTASYTLRK